MKDFFISYTQADRAWAEWLAWQLEAAVVFALRMDHQTVGLP